MTRSTNTDSHVYHCMWPRCTRTDGLVLRWQIQQSGNVYRWLCARHERSWKEV